MTCLTLPNIASLSDSVGVFRGDEMVAVISVGDAED